MRKHAGRLRDHPACLDAPAGDGPAGELIEAAPDGSSDVRINTKKALRVGDQGNAHVPTCAGPVRYLAYKGSSTVLINRKPAHRMGDEILHAGGIVPLQGGSSNVLIGGGGSRVPALSMLVSSCP